MAKNFPDEVYKDLIISTIVDLLVLIENFLLVYKDLIISTIVDHILSDNLKPCVYKDLIISTIVDLKIYYLSSIKQK